MCGNVDGCLPSDYFITYGIDGIALWRFCYLNIRKSPCSAQILHFVGFIQELIILIYIPPIRVDPGMKYLILYIDFKSKYIVIFC